MELFKSSDRSAVIDETGTYRYLLTRRFSTTLSRTILWVMLNPSTADAFVDDNTIRKISRLSMGWGFSGLSVVNLFALRSKSPRDLLASPDPVGPQNNFYLTSEIQKGPTVVCAWGNHGSLMDRDVEVKQMIVSEGIRPMVIGLNKGKDRRQPVHPLYQPNTSQLTEWVEERA